MEARAAMKDDGRAVNERALCDNYKKQFFRLIHELTVFHMKHEDLFVQYGFSMRPTLVHISFYIINSDDINYCRFMMKYLIRIVEGFINRFGDILKPFETELEPILLAFVTSHAMIGQSANKDSEADDKQVSIPEIPAEENLISREVFWNHVIVREIVEFLYGDDLRSCRLINGRWNEIIVSTQSEKGCLDCQCLVESDETGVRVKGETVCDCDMSFINTSLTSPFPLRKFCLGYAWKDHLRKMITFENVVIDSLNLTLPSVGHSIFEVPSKPEFFRPKYASQFNAMDAVTSLPHDLEWLDGTLKMISMVLSPKRLLNLKSMEVFLTLDEFYGDSTLTDDFYSDALTCILNNESGINYVLEWLTHFQITTCIPSFNKQNHTTAFSFVTTLCAKMIQDVCRVAKNINFLDLGQWSFHEEDRHQFQATIDAMCLPYLESLYMGDCLKYDNEMDSLNEMLIRCKQENPKFALTDIKFSLTQSGNEILDCTEFFKLVANTVKHLEVLSLSSRTTDVRNRTRWPVMTSIVSFRTTWYILKMFPDLELETKMPCLKTLTITCNSYADDDLDVHDLVPGFLSGTIPRIPIDYAQSPFEVKVSHPGVDMLVFEHGMKLHELCCNIPIKWNCPAVTSLTLKNMGCIAWFLSFVQEFPLLVELDITVRCDRICKDEDDDTSYADFIFTGLKIKKVYFLDEFENLSSLIPTDLISRKERSNCLLHQTNLKRLTVRHARSSNPDGYERVMSDWAGYHGFSLMTHLENLTVESRGVPCKDLNCECEPEYVLSDKCMEFVKQALETSGTRVSFTRAKVMLADADGVD